VTVPITNEMFSDFLKCPYKAYLKMAGESGQESDYENVEARLLQGYRVRARTHLVATCRGANTCRTTCSLDDVMKSEYDISMDVTACVDDVSVHFDAVLRRDRRPASAKSDYVPVMFIRQERVSREQKLELAFGASVFRSMGEGKPKTGNLIYGRDFRKMGVKLDRLMDAADSVLVGIRELRQATDPPTLRLNSQCYVCEFRTACHAAATEKDDLSLLRGLSEKEILKLNGRGIFTVTQYSYTSKAGRRSKKRRQAQRSAKHDVALQARAIRENTVYVADRPDLPRASAMVFLDVEGLPDEDFYYLIGLQIVRGSTRTWHSIWADSMTQEESIWRRLLAVLGDIEEEFHVYHYGSYEVRFFEKMRRAYGGNSTLVARIEAGLVNVLSAIYSHVYFPVYSNGLKDVASWLGFQWSTGALSGLQAIVWRREWEETGTDVSKQMLIDYNRDDCLALEHVSRWLALCAGEGSCSGIEAPGPVVSTDDMKPTSGWRIGTIDFEFAELAAVNQCAYFDYQRNRVYLRSTKKATRILQRGQRKHRGQYPGNRHVQFEAPAQCPECGRDAPSSLLCQSKQVLDLRFSGRSVKRWVVTYSTSWYRCHKCDATIVPEGYVRATRWKYGHALCMWTVYKNVGLGQSNDAIVEELFDVFGFSFAAGLVSRLKRRAARFYQRAYTALLRKLREGHVVHADETHVDIRGHA